MRYEIRSMTVGAILDRALRIQLRGFWIFLALSLSLAVPATLLFLALDAALGRPADPVTAAMHGWLATGVAFGMNLGVGVVVQGALIQAVSDVYLDVPLAIGRSFRLALSRFLPLVVTTFFYTLAVGVGSCLVVPGIYFQGALFAAVPTVVLERRGPIEALKRSWNLTAGSRWRAAGALVFAQLAPGLFGMTLSVILQAREVSPLVVQAWVQMAQALFLPYVAIVTILLYYDVRVRREAFDLQILALEAGRPPAPIPAPAP